MVGLLILIITLLSLFKHNFKNIDYITLNESVPLHCVKFKKQYDFSTINNSLNNLNRLKIIRMLYLLNQITKINNELFIAEFLEQKI